MTLNKSEMEQKQLTIDLAAFEGPLDLLLLLIKTLKIDIFDIPIVLVTQQYMDYLRQMKDMKLDIACDYLVMAATLIEIKTKYLLPKPAVEQEEEDDPREQLVEQLLAYKQYQEIGQVLDEKQQHRQLEYPKAPSNLTGYQSKVPLAENEVTTNDLHSAIIQRVERLKANQPVTTTVKTDPYSVDEGMTDIIERMKQLTYKKIAFSEILSQHPLTRSRVVTLFLALLELVKGQQIWMQQRQLGEDIILVRNEEWDGPAS